MAISKQQVPHGGWEYYQENTRTKLVGFTFDNLVSTVTAHRKANGLNHWQSEHDVEEQIEKNHPEISIK